MPDWSSIFLNFFAGISGDFPVCPAPESPYIHTMINILYSNSSEVMDC